MFESMKLGDTSGLRKREIAERVAKLKLPEPLASMAKTLVPVYGILIWTGPLFMTVLFYQTFIDKVQSPVQKAGVISFALIVFMISFMLVTGALSRLAQPGIVAGKFPRKGDHPVYALRRLYGMCWTQVYYFKPLYAFCLAIPPLKHILFRLFGFKGSMNFTIYPDSWIRDLPLVSVDEGAYIANRCVLGTNLCLNDGSILVGPVTMQKNSLVGHLAVFGLGTSLGEGSELGIGVGTGIRVKFNKNTSVKPKADVNHGTLVDDNSSVGTCATVGMKVEIGPNIDIRAGSTIPPGSVIKTQDDADKFYRSEIRNLQDQSAAVYGVVDKYMNHETPIG